MDSILADFMEGLWDTIEAETRVRGTTKNVTEFYKLEAGFPSELPKNITEYFHARGFFADLKPIQGAQQAMEMLVQDGYEVVVASTPCTPHSAEEKVIWLKKHFPMLDQKNLFLCHNKQMLAGDVIIDDALHNVRAFKKAQPSALAITIAFPYNHEDIPVGEPDFRPAYDLRAEGWENLSFAWGQIVSFLKADKARFIDMSFSVGRTPANTI